MTADRTIPMLRALADAPGGLSATELVSVAAADIQPRKRAVKRCRTLLEEQAGRGRVRRAGSVPAARSKVPMIVWQITDEGRRYLSMSPQDRRRRPPARPFMPHDVPLDGGKSARLVLPADLTADEAEQLCKLIRSLVPPRDD